jgi:hypothetical protein
MGQGSMRTDSKRRRVTPAALCVTLALAAGMAAAAGVHGADSPGALTHAAWLWDFALSAAQVYMIAPLVLLTGLMLWRGALSTNLCVGVTLGWYGLVFVAWMGTAWLSEGAFPQWGWRHYAIELLPIPLAMGLVFSIMSRTVGKTPR